jgi:hypothetical protein
MKTRHSIELFVLWVARLSAGLLLLFWGAFFVEHLQEWFLRADGRLPPASVWIAQLLHLLMLIGLATSVVRPVWGAPVTAVSTILFFLWIIGYAGFPNLALLNLPPVSAALILAVPGWKGRTRPGCTPDSLRTQATTPFRPG